MATEKGTTPTAGDANPGISPAPGILDDGDADFSKAHATVIEGARSAASKERSMTLMQGLRLYPKAIGWSVLISTCIVMEGYDISLVNNFCKLSKQKTYSPYLASPLTFFLQRRFPSV